WEEFYRVYDRMVARTVRHYVSDRQDAADVIQEVWLTVARRLPDFEWRENRGGFRAWMSKLIHDKTVDLIRRNLRRQARSRPESAPSSEPAAADGDPRDAMHEQLQREAIGAVIAALRPRVGELNFAILHLHYWEEQTVPAIGRQLRLSIDQVKCRLRRLLCK